MKKFECVAVAILLGLSTTALAIDRDARMIDTVSLNLAELDDVDSIGGSIWGETAFSVPRNDWAILFGGGYEELSPDHAPNVDAWTIGIGLKYYLTPVTSISGVGSFTHYDLNTGGDNKDAKAASVSVKQRLLSASDPISPFAKGTFTWRHRSTFSEIPPEESDDSFSEILLSLGGGADFNMSDTFAFVFEGAYVVADASDDGTEDLDGFTVSIGMQYYWY